jgi:hypothetical protein
MDPKLRRRRVDFFGHAVAGDCCRQPLASGKSSGDATRVDWKEDVGLT